ncbi:MAG: N-acyl homoserine lactonase family protein [Acidimicrobiales bacterium]
MPLSKLPPVDRLKLATVTSVPEWHPEHDAFVPFPVHAWVIQHPDGAILVDTGVGFGNGAIDEWYQPQSISLGAALSAVGLAPSEIAAVVLSHLHFDHCGQQRTLSAPTYVQVTEFEAAKTPGYTVADWAEVPKDRLQLVHGDEDIADGIRLISTPGHTPGHQSVAIEAGNERVVLAAQCAYHADELRTGRPASSNLHDESWAHAAHDSLQRLRALTPCTVHFSHDLQIMTME